MVPPVPVADSWARTGGPVETIISSAGTAAIAYPIPVTNTVPTGGNTAICELGTESVSRCELVPPCHPIQPQLFVGSRRFQWLLALSHSKAICVQMA